MSDSTTAVYTAAELATMDHSSRGYVVILTTTLCLTISGALVAARLYTRTRILKGLGADDYASVIAWVSLH